MLGGYFEELHSGVKKIRIISFRGTGHEIVEEFLDPFSANMLPVCFNVFHLLQHTEKYRHKREHSHEMVQ